MSQAAAVPEVLPDGIPPLKRGSAVRFGVGNLSVNLIVQTFAALGVFYYVDTLGADPRLIALAMMLHGVFNAVLNPVFGHISDRTRSRWGRRIPYVLFGAVPLVAAFVMIWVPLASTPMGLFWYFLGIVAVFDVLFVLVILNYGALFPEMFITAGERSVGASWRQLFAVLGLILGVALAPILYGSFGWAAMGAILGVVALIGFAVALTATAERRPAPVEGFGLGAALRHTFRNKAFIAYVVGSLMMQVVVAIIPASVPFYTKYVLGDADPVLNSAMLGTVFLVAIPAIFAWTVAIRRIGARGSILLTILVFAAGLTGFLFAGSLAAALAACVLVGIGVAGMMILLDLLLAEVIDIDAAATGSRREGMYLGINGFVVRWAVSIQAVVFGVMLPWGGYDQSLQTQPDTVALAIRLMISLIPVAFLALAAVAFWFYPRGAAAEKE